MRSLSQERAPIYEALEEFKKIYSDYDIVSCEPVFYEQTGWHIYLKMWKKKPKKGRKEDKKCS